MGLPIVVETAPFWSGVASDPKLNLLGEILWHCSNDNGGCEDCPLVLKCRGLWNQAVVVSVAHPQKGLNVRGLRFFATKFYHLTQYHAKKL
ncbi:hypothetical protein ES703_107432 [subsurface metagenome]